MPHNLNVTLVIEADSFKQHPRLLLSVLSEEYFRARFADMPDFILGSVGWLWIRQWDSASCPFDISHYLYTFLVMRVVAD